MSRNGVLDRLRDEWVIGKGLSSLCGVAGWVVCKESDGEIWRIGWGKTVKAAIDAAEAYVAEEDRRQAERDADYARRKAAGLLTPMEIAGSFIPQIWSTEIVKAVETYQSGLVNRADFEREILGTGDAIKIKTFQDLPVSTGCGNPEDVET